MIGFGQADGTKDIHSAAYLGVGDSGRVIQPLKREDKERVVVVAGFAPVTKAAGGV